MTSKQVQVDKNKTFILSFTRVIFFFPIGFLFSNVKVSNWRFIKEFPLLDLMYIDAFTFNL